MHLVGSRQNNVHLFREMQTLMLNLSSHLVAVSTSFCFKTFCTPESINISEFSSSRQYSWNDIAKRSQTFMCIQATAFPPSIHTHSSHEICFTSFCFYHSFSFHIISIAVFKSQILHYIFYKILRNNLTACPQRFVKISHWFLHPENIRIFRFEQK